MTGWAGMGVVDPSEWQVVSTGDFNGDGTSDILWQRASDGLLGAWLMHGGAMIGWGRPRRRRSGRMEDRRRRGL